MQTREHRRPSVPARVLAIAVLGLVAACGEQDGNPTPRSDEPSSPASASSPPSPSGTPEEAQELLDEIRRSVFESNLGRSRATLTLSGVSVSTESTYRLKPRSSVHEVSFETPDDKFLVEGLEDRGHFWMRLPGMGGDPTPCWMRSDRETLAQFTGQEFGPGMQSGVPAPIAAVDRSSQPQFVGDDRLRVRANLAAITASAPGKLYFTLNIDPLSYAKVEVDLTLNDGTYTGWSVEVDSLVDAAIEAGFITEDEFPIDKDLLTGSVVVELMEVEVDVDFRHPPKDQVVALTPDDQDGFEAAMNACSAR